MKLKHEWIKLRFQINALKIEYRMAVMLGILFIILMVWQYLIFSPLNHAMKTAKQNIESSHLAKEKLQKKIRTLLSASQNPETHLLIQKYQRLDRQITNMQVKLQQIPHKTLNSNDLAQFINLFLKENQNIKIRNFSLLNKLNSVENPATQANSTKTSPQEKIPKSITTRKTLEAEEVSHYILAIEGDYFSIMDYLFQFEKIDWQIVWDSMDYEVKNHPLAVATLKFHTPSQTKATKRQS